ncbi:hypothetical protein [Muricoccus radiodurans]|uniref:hypothetical protein n=1 Tax=Muricoccus radiodurans TaxID=2231721 RepID=UPI003CE80DBA
MPRIFVQRVPSGHGDGRWTGAMDGTAPQRYGTTMIRFRTNLSLACLGLLALLSACAAPPDAITAAQSPVQSMEALPREMAGFRREGFVVDYARQVGNPGLGASARYVPMSGERVIATVYIYDRGVRRSPEGGSSPDVDAELRSTLGEVQALVQLGRYRSFAPELAMSMSGPGGGTDLRCRNFRLGLGDGVITGDSVCVTIQGGAFVKVRVSSFQRQEPTAAGLMAASLLSAVVQARAPVR